MHHRPVVFAQDRAARRGLRHARSCAVTAFHILVCFRLSVDRFKGCREERRWRGWRQLPCPPTRIHPGLAESSAAELTVPLIARHRGAEKILDLHYIKIICIRCKEGIRIRHW